MKRRLSWPEIRSVPHKLRWRRERARRGFSEADAWDLFAYLSPIIAGGCRELIREGSGSPGTITYEEWHRILAEIATGFEASIRASENVEDRPPELDRAFVLLAKWWEHLWD